MGDGRRELPSPLRLEEALMKKLIGFLAGLTVAASVFAGDYDINCLTNSPVSTNAVTTRRMDGYIDSISIKAPTAWTGVVAFATEFGTFFTTPGNTQTNRWTPRFVSANDSIGGAFTMTNAYRMLYLSQDTITCTVTSSSTASTNDIRITITTVGP